MATKFKLPPRGSKPKKIKRTRLQPPPPPPLTILNPAGGEIYKLYARYPSKPALGPCSFKIFWKGGLPTATNLTISLIDIKNWVVNTVIATNVANVPAGQVGMLPFTLPANFQPTDDCATTSTYPSKYGRYQIYIQGGNPLSWTYGPEFTITWSE